MKKRVVLIGKIFACIVALALLFIQADNHRRSIPPFCDESSWVALTNLYDPMSRGDFRNPLWISFRAYDHPPLAKYVYGFYLSLRNPDFSEIRDRLIEKHLPINRTCKTTPTAPFVTYIYQMRTITATLTIFTSIMLGIIGMLMTTSSFIFIVAPLIAMQQPIFPYQFIATSDAFYIFFLLVSFIFFLLFLRKHQWTALFFSGASMGLSLASKLTAMVFVGSFIAYICVFSMVKKQWREGVFRLVIFIAAAGVFWAGINPTLYPDPVRQSVAYVRWQMRDIHLQQQLQEEWPKKTVMERAVFALMKIFPSGSSVSEKSGAVLRIGLFIAGLFYSVRKVLRRSIEHSFVLFISFCTTLGVIVTLQLPWERYLLPVVIPVLIYQIIGFFIIVRIGARVVDALSRVASG